MAGSRVTAIDLERPASPAAIAPSLIVVLIMALLPPLISGDWDWWQACFVASLFILSLAVSRFLAARRHPGPLAERARLTQHKDVQPWDRLLAPRTALGGASIPIVAGMDTLLTWSPPDSPLVKATSLVLILAGIILSSYALVENRYFSGVVRLQADRGHQLVSSGPYRWIRHPGYAGPLLAYLATPVFLDAPWALMPGFLRSWY